MSPIWGEDPTEWIEMKICTGVELRDVIMDVKFKFEKFMRFWCHCGSKFTFSPLTLHVGLTTVECYCFLWSVLTMANTELFLAKETSVDWTCFETRWTFAWNYWRLMRGKPTRGGRTLNATWFGKWCRLCCPQTDRWRQKVGDAEKGWQKSVLQ